MLLMGCGLLQHDIQPICGRIVVRIGSVLRRIFIDVFLSELGKRTRSTIIVLEVIDGLHPIDGTDHLRLCGRLVDCVVIVVIHRELVLLGTTGGDQDDSCGCPRSIDGS